MNKFKRYISFLMLLPAVLSAATITGTVTTGATGGAAGTPVASAKVVLIAGGGGGGGARLDSTTTEADGKYSFTLDTTGFRQIQASATGYNTGTANVNVANDTGTFTANINISSNAPGSLTGKVVKASDSSALAGARVILSRQSGGGGGFTPDTTLTGSDGTYTFSDVPGNTGYALNVSLTGYETSTRNNISVPGGQAATQNFALAPPAPPGSIAGKVVKASDSSALAGVRVILSRQGGGGTFTPDTTETTAAGTYSFADVPANNNYTLNVSLTGYQTIVRNNVTVTSGQAATQNFALAPPIGPGSIAGKITNAAGGSALSGARVILSRSGGGGGGGFDPDTVLTDAQGAFTYDSVPNQTNYILTVSATGFGTQVNNNVDVSGGLKTTVNFALSAAEAGDTTGTIQGLVANSSAAPIANARVILSRTSGGGNGTPLDTVVTDASGKFSFTKLAAPGSYRLNVSGTGYQNAQSNTISLAEGVTFIANVDLSLASGIRSARMGFSPTGSHWMDGRLVVDLDASKQARAAEVYGFDGSLKFRMVLEPGTTRVILPAQVKPGMGTLRIQY